MARGHIKTLNRERQFGFIRDSEGVPRFFHETAVLRGVSFDDLKQGQAVEFEPKDHIKGPRAENVRLAAAVTH